MAARVCPPPATARDAAFLAALDPTLVGDLVQRHLVAHGALVELIPDYVRWKDQDGSLLGFRAVVASKDRLAETYVSVRTAAAGRLADEAERLKHRCEELHAGMRAFALVPEVGMLLLALPIDRTIGDLRRYLQASKVRTLLANACPELIPSHLRISKSRSRHHLVRYKPERRAVLRWEMALVGAGDLREGSTTVWLRCLATPLGERSALATRLAAGADVRCPVALAVPHDRLVVESHVDGQPWGFGTVDHDLAAARTLARLHAADDLGGLPTHGPLEQLDLALRAAEDLGRLQPELGRRAASIADQLTRRVPQPSEPVLAHGDMHRGQVLIGADGIAGLVDFDRACAAPAALDLATVLAHEVYSGVPDGIAAARRMRAEYGVHRALPGREELAWWDAAALLRTAGAPFRALRPDWQLAAAGILERAVAALEMSL